MPISPTWISIISERVGDLVIIFLGEGGQVLTVQYVVSVLREIE